MLKAQQTTATTKCHLNIQMPLRTDPLDWPNAIVVSRLAQRCHVRATRTTRNTRTLNICMYIYIHIHKYVYGHIYNYISRTYSLPEAGGPCKKKKKENEL